MSSNPFPPVRYPNLLLGSRSINCHQLSPLFPSSCEGLTARIHCIPEVEHLSATSSGHVKCSCRIAFVNAVFVRPLNGRFPNNSSYLSVSWSLFAGAGKLTLIYLKTSNPQAPSIPSLPILQVLFISYGIAKSATAYPYKPYYQLHPSITSYPRNELRY